VAGANLEESCVQYQDQRLEEGGAVRAARGEVFVRSLIAGIGALLLAAPVSGHHSDSGLDLDTLVTVEGTVTDFSWRNPHVYFTVEATDEEGTQVEWTIQMASVATVSRMGWTSDSLAVGDQVAIGAYPARDGRAYAKFLSIEKSDGIALPTSFDSETGEVLLSAPEVTASTTTLEGKWMADGSALNEYPGRLDGLTRALLRLTEDGRARQAAYDENSDENPELRCVGRPTPAMIVYTDLYPLQIEFSEAEKTIAIRSQFFDEERTVYVDGRGHPEGQRFHEGHSIGWWEGNTLVIDTRHFTDHRSPYQNGIPSGAQKHVMERYQLNEDGTRMIVEFTLEDPEYILEPMTHTRELIYSPQADMSPFNCDPESTRRFRAR